MKKFILLLFIGAAFSCSRDELNDDITISSSNFSFSKGNTCFFAFQPQMNATEFFPSAGNSFEFGAILDWDFSNAIHDSGLTATTSTLEIREYPNFSFCLDQIPSGAPEIYTFPIPDLNNNPIGTFTATFGQDFFRRCFEWRIVTTGIITDSSDGSTSACATNTSWNLFRI